MIESSQKKAVFLREALNAVGRKASIIARRFEDIEAPEVSFVSCRALDQFMESAGVDRVGAERSDAAVVWWGWIAK